MSIDAFLQTHILPHSYRSAAQKWFNPLAHNIALHQKSAGSSFTVGIHGCQGSGKSTLADYLAHILTDEYQLKVAVCSLDDFYLAKDKRQHLAKTIHPLLATRGVPGTHDTQLLEQVLLHIQQQNTLSPLAIPRFDKSTDNPAPHGEWPVYSMPVDVLILEGWCWGVPPQDEDALKQPVNELEAAQDQDGSWRRYVNTQLQNVYQPMYGLIDMWVMLKAPSFQQVATWREEQETKLRLAVKDQANSRVMSPEQVLQFIQFFQRLTDHAIDVMPSLCDWVYTMDADRNITQCIHPSGDVV